MSTRRDAAPAAVRWTAYVAVAIVFAVACGFLSNWQFTRNADRSAQLELVDRNYDADPVALADVIPSAGALAPGDEWRPVVLEGEYLAAQQVLVRNRPHGGTAAFEVLVPFRLDDGRVLLIDRGWVRPGETQPLPDEIPAPPDGEVTVIARLRPAESVPASGRSAPEGQVPSITPALVADQLGGRLGADADLELSAYGVMVSEDPAPATRPEALTAPSDDPGPYLSYAIQWILFAVMGFVFIGYVIRTERRHRREEAEDRANGIAPRERVPARRTDRDMEEEDSLLDNAGR